VEKMKNVLMLASAATLLGGCATTSFAPPSVNLTNVMETRGSNRSIGQSCKSFEKLADNKPVPIKESVDGARSLINNFILLYRCRAHSAANGRQIFEIPSFLTAVGTITATAFGAGSNVAIAGGSAASILNGSRNYYDPKGKADIFDSSLDALICIKMEAVGIDGFSIKKIQGEAEKNILKFETGENRFGVDVGPETQYFDLVSSSLLSVERILAQRLSAVGVFDPAGVVAEIKQLSDDIEQASSPAAVADAQNKAQPLALSTAEKATAARTLLEINALKPKLQSCVVRAKL
tara:strand:- start:817 stop:1692 length:876 start_codon:yes stop_codon:yes gene_type:complete